MRAPMKRAEVHRTGPLRDPEVASRLLPLVAVALAGSAFEHRSRWPQAVVVLRAEEKRVTSRGDFTHWLIAHDLGAAARECTSRKLPTGHVLVWLEVDVPDVAAAGFLVFDLAAAMKEAA